MAQFQKYKPEQGKISRAVFAVLVILFGLFVSVKWVDFWKAQDQGGFMTMKILGFLNVYYLPVLIFIALALFLIYKFSFMHPKTVDYLIETETELKKVSWPNKEEIKGSTTVVIVTMVILALIITFFDFLMQQVAKVLFYS